MVDRKRLGDYALDLLLFAGMVSSRALDATSKVATLTLGQMATGVYIAKNFLSSLSTTLADPDKEKHEQARLRAKEHLERLRRGQNVKDGVAGEKSDDSSVSKKGPRVEELMLNEYENLIAMEMVAPEDIPVGFDGELSGARPARQAANSVERHRRLGRYHRRVEGVGHLPADYATSLLPRSAFAVCALWRPALWPTRLRQNHAG